MNLGKISLIVFVVFVTVIGFATLQDYSSDENKLIDANFPSQDKTIEVDISDGVGSVDIGK
ncbi:MAG: hypothetical protein WEB28_01930 [Nitrosopumilaceae archaeon]